MKFIRLMILVGLFGLTGCQTGPKPIEYGQEECVFCKMTVMDKRFGCQVMNTKGKPFNFDDLSCMVGYMNTGIIAQKDIAGYYVPDYPASGNLLPAEKLFYVVSESFRSPMAGNVAGFSNLDSAIAYAARLNGSLIEWESIINHD